MADLTVIDLLRKHGMVAHPTLSPNHLARFLVRNAVGRCVFDGSEAEILAWLETLGELSFEVRCRLAKQLAKDMVKAKELEVAKERARDKGNVTAAEMVQAKRVVKLKGLVTGDEILEAICDMGWASGAAEATELLDGERYLPSEAVKRKKRSPKNVRDRGKHAGRTYK